MTQTQDEVFDWPRVQQLLNNLAVVYPVQEAGKEKEAIITAYVEGLHVDLLSEERRRRRVLKDLSYLISAVQLYIDNRDPYALKRAIEACEQRHDV